MQFFDLPPQLRERVVCSITASVKYAVPANIVLAVAEKEAGKPGQWKKNSNGTHDVGPMQFNTSYVAELARYGITANDVAAAGCYSFDLAAWRLRRHIRNDKGDLWTKAANYHSKTRQYNRIYRADLIQKAVKWANWLDARFNTFDVTQPGAAASTLKYTQSASPAVTTQLMVVPTAAMLVQSVRGSGNTVGYVPRKLIIDRQ
jgi:hypothetical protein